MDPAPLKKRVPFFEETYDSSKKKKVQYFSNQHLNKVYLNLP